MVNQRGLRSGSGLLLGLVGTALAVSACGLIGGTGGGPPPPQPPAPTTVSLDVSTSFASSGGVKCVSSTPNQWGVVPLAVAPGAGRSTPLTEEDKPKEWSPSGGRCVMSYRFADLQPGRWRVWVAAGVASGTCEADFKAGTSWVVFLNGVCSVTP
jgi:hypothetical protein